MTITWGASRAAVFPPTNSELTLPASRAEDSLPPIDQRLEVSFHYRVLFTEQVVAVDNPLLVETLASSQASTPTKFLCVVEEGAVRHRPGLLAAIHTYAR